MPSVRDILAMKDAAEAAIPPNERPDTWLGGRAMARAQVLERLLSEGQFADVGAYLVDQGLHGGEAWGVAVAEGLRDTGDWAALDRFSRRAHLVYQNYYIGRAEGQRVYEREARNRRKLAQRVARMAADWLKPHDAVASKDMRARATAIGKEDAPALFLTDLPPPEADTLGQEAHIAWREAAEARVGPGENGQWFQWEAELSGEIYGREQNRTDTSGPASARAAAWRETLAEELAQLAPGALGSLAAFWTAKLARHDFQAEAVTLEMALLLDVALGAGDLETCRRLWDARVDAAVTWYLKAAEELGVLPLAAERMERVGACRRAVLERQGRAAELATFEATMALAREGKRPPPPPVTDKRRITEAVFWELIEAARLDADGTPRPIPEAVAGLRGRLLAFPVSGTIAFERVFAGVLNRLYTVELWALGAQLEGGLMGDDGFENFRALLILHGRKTTELVAADPAAAWRWFAPEGEASEAEDLVTLSWDLMETRGADPERLPDAPQPAPLSDAPLDEAAITRLFPPATRLVDAPRPAAP
ncbi:MAG: DUF4240 domain-containing protein [Pseudomonadota bacterium]